jgi:hypothetical protein
MKGHTLMLITDISGYTKFMTRVGHEEGLRRAQDLLQIVINANTLGLKLCEIEGDAVFFYAIGSLPSRSALLRQIGRTYTAFNRYLVTHDLDAELGIKFFVHTGECEEIRIGGRTKLYGMDVIKIHRLLKSITKKDDYLLVTRSAAEALSFEKFPGVDGATEFPHIGSVAYTLFNERYLQERIISEPTKYALLQKAFIDGMMTMVAELSKQYSRYAAMMNPLHEKMS